MVSSINKCRFVGIASPYFRTCVARLPNDWNLVEYEAQITAILIPASTSSNLEVPRAAQLVLFADTNSYNVHPAEMIMA